MSADSLLGIAISLTMLMLLMAIPATAFIKFFARPLTWGQAFSISTFCFAITTAGVLITRRAQAYGIEKAGWLGVGGKTVLALVAFSWVLVGLLYVLIT